MDGKEALKVEVEESVKRVFKRALSEIEMVLMVVEYVIATEDTSGDKKLLKDIFLEVRSRILSTGKSEIKRLHDLIGGD